MIKSWSISRLVDFESCKYKIKLKLIDKIPEPERPLPKGKTEHANDRGTRIHTECENYVMGNSDALPKEAKDFEANLIALREAYKDGRVDVEGEWGFDEDWKPTSYKTAWLKVKCDYVMHIDKKHLCVVDLKTGRKFGNEVKHAEQGQLYAIAAAIKYPEAETITVEFWYLDQNEDTQLTKPTKKWLAHLKLYDKRGRKMTDEQEFKPSPSGVACKWCPYKEGICEYAVNDDIQARATKEAYKRKAIQRKAIP